MRNATRTASTTSKVFEPELVVEIVCGVAVGCGVAVATAVAVGCGARVGRAVAVAAGAVAVAAGGGVAVGSGATVGAVVAVGSGGVAVCAGTSGLAASRGIAPRRCPCWSADAMEIAACAVASTRSISASAQVAATSATAPARQRLRCPAGARPVVALVRVLRCSGIRHAPSAPRDCDGPHRDHRHRDTAAAVPRLGRRRDVPCIRGAAWRTPRRAASAVAPAAKIRLYSPVSSRLGDMLHVAASERARQSRSISE
jgi:hypothetical protein